MNETNLQQKQSEIEESVELNNTLESSVPQQAVSEVFTLFPRLAEIGTTEQYELYLQNIFPQSHFKEIVWHFSNANFINEGFKPVQPNFDTLNSIPGIYNFSTNRDFVSRYGGIAYAVVVDLQQPIYEESSGEYADDMDRTISEALYKIGKKNDDNPLAPGYDEKLKDTDGVINDISGETYVKKHPVTGREYGGIPAQKVVTVFRAEQIHILGSDKDQKAFESFVNLQK